MVAQTATQKPQEKSDNTTTPTTAATPNVPSQDLAQTVKGIVNDRTANEQRVSKLVEELNAHLPSLGYKIVSVEETNGHVETPRRRGRPKGSTSSASTAKKTLKCPKCSMRFSHPMHLGRHVNSAHKRGSKK